MLGKSEVASLMIAEVNTKTNISTRDLGNIQQVARGSRSCGCMVQVSQRNFRVLICGLFELLNKLGTSLLLNCAVLQSKSNTLKCDNRKQGLKFVT